MNNTPTTKDAYKLFHDGILAFSKAEQNGMCIDVDYCKKESKKLQYRINGKRKKLLDSKIGKLWQNIFKNNINLNSDLQLKRIIFDELNFKSVKETTKGNPSTDMEALTILSKNIPEVQLILDIRKMQKIKDTYLKGFLREQVNGILHPFFNLHTTISYRSSSSNINFQNIPKRDKEAQRITRKAIIPRKGNQLLEVDFSGLEVSISACYHKDPVMINYLLDSTTDMHRDMCQELYILNDNEWTKDTRFYAKNCFVFPEFYGDWYASCAESLWKSIDEAKLTTKTNIPLKKHLKTKKIKNYNQFENHVKNVEYDFWNKRFKIYDKWKEKYRKEYYKKGYFISHTGFKYQGVMDRKQIVNYPIQGSAFHCLLWCFIKIMNIAIKEKWNTKIIGQIHDAIVFDVDPKELKHVLKVIKKVTTIDLLKHYKWIIVPLEVDAELCPVDGAWNTKEDIKI